MRVLKKALTYCSAPIAELTFWSRSWLRFRRGPPCLIGEPKAVTGTGLCTRYGLDDYRDTVRSAVWQDALWRLEALEVILADRRAPAKTTLSAIDVGCQSWSYVYPLARFLARWAPGRSIEIAGYEIDAHALLPDFRSRRDWAEAYCAQVSGASVRYLPQDFLTSRAEGVDLVTLFFPFVTRYALLEWGLPLSCFKPRAMFTHALGRMAEGGLLVTVHQTRKEADLARALVASLCTADAELLCEVPLSAALAPDPDAARDRIGLVFRSRSSSARRS